MTQEFELLLRYKKLARDVAQIEAGILKIFAHPGVSDTEILEWREKYRELRKLHHRVRDALNKKGVRV